MVIKKTTEQEQASPAKQAPAHLAAAIDGGLGAEAKPDQAADLHHGQGGLYELVSGERRLVERTEAA